MHVTVGVLSNEDGFVICILIVGHPPVVTVMDIPGAEVEHDGMSRYG